jgi:hypothetical protein
MEALTVLDDFNDGIVNPGLWDVPVYIGNADLAETNGHLHFYTLDDPGTGAYRAILPMKALAQFDVDWEVQIFTALPDFENDATQQLESGLLLLPNEIGKVASNRISHIVAKNEANQKKYYQNLEVNGVEIFDYGADRTSDSALLRMRWDAATSNLFSDISTDGGTTWTNYWPSVANPFNMTDSDQFVVALYAASKGRPITISDNLYFDDFKATIYSGPLNGSDDFNDNIRDTSKWIEAEPLLTETNNRLEFTTSGTGDENGNWTWVKNAGSYTQDWAVSVDVYNSSVPFNQSSSIAMGIVGHNVSEGPLFVLGLLRSTDPGHVIGGGWPDYYTWHSTTNTSAKLTISYDATTETLSGAYSLGGGFIMLTNRNISWLPAGTSESFIIALIGSTENDFLVESGEMYLDNFEAVTLPYSATITNYHPVASGFKLEWIPAYEWVSVVKWSTNLVKMPFTDLSESLSSPINSFTDTVHSTEDECFYRVDVQIE